ncbi:MAG: hypothetical protein ACI8TQ_002537 [Planctomycetota bacterium]|jgi:hypothetical protein
MVLAMKTALHTKLASLLALTLVMLGVVGTSAAAQSEVTYRARLTSGVAKLGEELQLLIVVENASATVDSVPSVEGLEIGRVGSPAFSESISITGARRVATRSLTWRISVRPLKTGEFMIPGVQLTIGNQSVVTAPLDLQVVEDLLGEELGFFELNISGDRMIEKMPFEMEMLFGWDAALSSKVDYAKLILPWWGKLNELLELEQPSGFSNLRMQTIQLNSSEQVEVEEVGNTVRDGREYRTFRMRRVFLPTRSAELSLARPFLEFGKLGARSIFGSSRKKEAYFVSGEPIELSIGTLPSEGQPIEYTGAVGTISARADVDTRDVDVGESIKVLVTWEGDGNLLFFDPPQLDRNDDFERFRVFGSANREKSLHRRVIEFDIAALDDKVSEIPPIALSVYDPVEEAFVTVTTEPIRIRVRPLVDAVMLEDGAGGNGLGNDIEDIVVESLSSNGRDAQSKAPGLMTLGLFGGAVFVGWLAFRTEFRRRRGDPNAPIEKRRRRARKQLATDLSKAQSSAEELSALNRFLSARSRESEVAWVGRDPIEHLTVEQSEVGEKLAKAISGLERGAYAAEKNGAQAPGSGEILELADQLIRGGL